MSEEMLGSERSEQRQRIVEAMIRCVGASDYPSTSVDEVVAEANVSAEAFAAQFQSKEECFVEAVNQLDAEVTQRVFSAFNAESDWREQLRAAADAALGWLEDEPEHARVGFTLELVKAPERAIAHRDRTIEILVGLIDAGRQELADPESVPRSVAESLAEAIMGTVTLRMARGESEFRPLVPQFLCMATMPYVGRQEALKELSREPIER
jgi:AcrR family transcriptional regulator